MFRWILMALLLMAAPARAAGTAYSTVIEDLPLMQGMQEKADEAVIFDQPGGRILETQTIVAAPPSAVTDFYAAALPSLGWQATSATTYTRDKETLTLAVERTGGLTAAHFTLTPTEGK